MVKERRIDRVPVEQAEEVSLRRVVLAAALLLAVAPAIGLAAGPDDNIEWNGVSHVWWLDRRPICPIDGQGFDVLFQTYRDDITSARVRVDDGDVAWIEAVKTAARGPYDVWSASIPSTGAPALSYFIELTDGTDTDYLSAGGMSDSVPTDGGFVVDYETLSHAPLGATPVDGGAVFRVWAPTRASVSVRGEFNGWSTGDPLAKLGEDFVGFVPDAGAGQMYKYFFDGSHWNTDARARALNPSNNYNAYVEDPLGYSWQLAGFDTPDFEQMVVYQLHVGTFAGRNDPYGSAPFPSGYVDVAARASHLAELGVNAVMLNPVTEFPGDYSAGYNPVTQWAPEWKYGSPDDLKYMIDVLHQHGIAVILDIVWNHFSFSDNFLWYYDGTQTYFDDPAVSTPWGDQADFDREAVRRYFLDSAMMWLEEYHIDGFRMDATSYMNIYPQDGSGWSLMQQLNDVVDNRWVDKITVAEQLPDNSWVTRPTSLGGAGFDSQYYDAFTDQLRQEIFDAAYGDPEMWRIRDIVNGGGDYLSGRYVMNYLELHDEAWPSSGGQRIVKTIDTTDPHDDEWAQGRVKLGQGIVMTAPGIPAILMGTEWLEDTDFGTDSSNRIDWSKKTTYPGIFRYFQDVIALRKTSAALRADAYADVFHVNEGGNVVAFERRGGNGDELVVVASFANTDYGAYRIGVPSAGEWVEVLNSQDSVYGGSGLTNPGALVAEDVPYDGFAQSIVLALPKMGLLILSPEATSSVPGDDEEAVSRLRLSAPVPNPFNPRTSISFILPAEGDVRLTVHDVSGRLVATLVNGRLRAGPHAVEWNGTADGGAAVASGIYMIEIVSGGERRTGKAVLLR
jgi:1,4-alpha-glucan branching enzyme